MTLFDTAADLSATAADIAANLAEARRCPGLIGRARELLDELADEIGDERPGLTARSREVPAALACADADRPVPYALTAKALGSFPPVVCLCGSTRFYDEFRRANLRLTLDGQIVLSIGCDTKSDGDLGAAAEFGTDPASVKFQLDELHKRKIDLADYVLVLNVGGYTGASTRSEIAYAAARGKPVRYLTAPAGDTR